MDKNKNMFDVLADGDSADDNEEQPKRKLSKKEQRENEKLLRETHGDKVEKEDHKKSHEGQVNKGDYDANEKRPFDRHSGTGKQAFGHVKAKGGGHGGDHQEDLKSYQGTQGIELVNEEDKIDGEKEDDLNAKSDKKDSNLQNKKKSNSKKIKYDEDNFPKLE